MTEQTRQLLRDLLAALEQESHVSVSVAALKLDCSPKFIRDHLDFFPNAWRFPGKYGQVRIPVKDIENIAEKFHLFNVKSSRKRNKSVPTLKEINQLVNADVPTTQ